jgi:hypothetical protein
LVTCDEGLGDQLDGVADLDVEPGLADARGQVERAARIGGDDQVRVIPPQGRNQVRQERARHIGLLQQIGPCGTAAALTRRERGCCQARDTGQQTMNRGVPAELVTVRAGLVHQDATMDGAHLDRRRPVGPVQEVAQLLDPPKRRVISQLGHAGAGETDDRAIAVDPSAGLALRVGFGGIAVVSEHGAAAARRGKHPDPQAQASQHLSGRIDRPALRRRTHAAGEEIEIRASRILRDDTSGA